jgi:hypothetical protein
MNKGMEQEVRRRARGRCEYCHLPEIAFELRHEIDHVIAQKHHGPTTLENLALCCGRCNLHKGPNLSGIDPDTGLIQPLFNPRSDRWRDHFRWNGPVIVGVTPIGRATIDVLVMNDPNRVDTRRRLMEEFGGELESR